MTVEMCNSWIRRIVGNGLILPVAILIQGCPVPLPSGYPENSRENLGVEVNSLLTEGVSTREDVLLLLGEPDGVGPDDSWLAYGSVYSHGGVLFLLCYQGCMGAGGENMEYRRLIVTFDDSGLMTKAKFVSQECWEYMAGAGNDETRSTPCMQINVPAINDQDIFPQSKRIPIPDDLLDFANGNAELPKTNTLTSIYRFNSGKYDIDAFQQRKELHDGKRWEALARATLSGGLGYALEWYYLGRAAEGMALCDAAEIYYKKSKGSPHSRYFNADYPHFGSAGIKPWKALQQRLSAIESMRIAGECRAPTTSVETEPSSLTESTSNPDF